MTLTTMERTVLEGLRSFHSEHGKMPTAKQLVAFIGWRSRGPLTPTLRSLATKGRLTYKPSRDLPVVLL